MSYLFNSSTTGRHRFKIKMGYSKLSFHRSEPQDLVTSTLLNWVSLISKVGEIGRFFSFCLEPIRINCWQLTTDLCLINPVLRRSGRSKYLYQLHVSAYVISEYHRRIIGVQNLIDNLANH